MSPEETLDCHDDRRDGRWRRIWLDLLAVFLLGGLVYSNTLHAPFAFDDQNYIIGNPVLADWRGFVDSDHAERLMANGKLNQNFRTRIVTVFTFALNHQWLGGSLTGYHLVNILIHLSNAILVYWLVYLILRTPFCAARTVNRGAVASVLPLLAALFFVCHPVQTQAVTYISQRFTSLATFFYLGALVAYAYWRQANLCADGVAAPTSWHGRLLGRRWGVYLLSLAATVLAMKSKEISFTLPVMVISYELSFFPGGSRRRWCFLVPFLLTMAIIPLALFGRQACYRDVGLLKAAVTHRHFGYLITQFRVVVTYLRLLLLPVNQVLEYEYPSYQSLLQLPVFLSFLLLAAIAGGGCVMFVLAKRSGQRRAGWERVMSFGIIWFFLALAVETSVIPLDDPIFEHRVYLPSVGFVLFLIGVTGALADRLKGSARQVLAGALVAMLMLLSWAAYARNGVWGSTLALWEDVARKSPTIARPHLFMGKYYKDREQQHEAIREFKAALDRVLSPEIQGEVYGSIAICYIELGDNQAAMPWIERMARSPVERRDDHLGLLYLWVNRLPEAEQAWRRAILVDDDPVFPLLNLGKLYLDEKRIAEAELLLLRASSLDPGNGEVILNLGLVRMAKGELVEAERDFQRLLVLDPGDETVRTRLTEVRHRLHR